MDPVVGATVALAVFGFWEWLRSVLDRRAATREREARLSTLAFLVRRQLRSWIGADPALQKGLWGWIELTRQHQTFSQHVALAESRMMEAVTLASQLGSKKERALFAAYHRFLTATSQLANFDAISPSDHTRPTWQRVFEEVRTELEAVISALETDAIRPQVLALAQESQQPELPSGDEKQ